MHKQFFRASPFCSPLPSSWQLKIQSQLQLLTQNRLRHRNHQLQSLHHPRRQALKVSVGGTDVPKPALIKTREKLKMASE